MVRTLILGKCALWPWPWIYEFDPRWWQTLVLMLRPFFPELVMSSDFLSFEHPSVLLFCLDHTQQLSGIVGNIISHGSEELWSWHIFMALVHEQQVCKMSSWSEKEVMARTGCKQTDRQTGWFLYNPHTRHVNSTAFGGSLPLFECIFRLPTCNSDLPLFVQSPSFQSLGVIHTFWLRLGHCLPPL